MTRTITVKPSDSVFSIEGKSRESILTAALRNGHTLNYGCSNGNCGLCKARLISGQIDKVDHYDFRLSDTEKAQNYFLMCAHTAVDDIVIEALEADTADDISEQQVRMKVKKIDPSPNHLMIVHLQTPRTNTLRFLAGQTVKILQQDFIAGQFFIASCPCDDRNIQLHIPETWLDANTALQQALTVGKSVEITGPYGDFTLQEKPPKPAIMVAIDAGFAPLKSLIEHAIAIEFEEPIVLLRAHPGAELPYLENLCRSWYDAFDNIKIINLPDPSMQELAEDVIKNLRGLPEAIIYLAGPNEMITTLTHALNHANAEAEIRQAPIDQLV